MFQFLKEKFLSFPSRSAASDFLPSDTQLDSSLLENLIYFRREFDNSADLTIREIDVTGTSAAVVSIEGMINKQILATSVLNPITGTDTAGLSPQDKFDFIRDQTLGTADQVQFVTFKEAFQFVMSGFALLLLDGCPFGLAIGIQGFSFRSISEPSSEVMQRGSREGFVEPVRINITMIRRRIKSPQLKFEMMKVGSLSQTDVCLCYLRGSVSESVLEEIRTRLRSTNLETAMASGYLSPYLEEAKDWSLFSSVGFSERPDTVCGKISEGRVAVLIDGTPNALIVPYLFVEYFQTMDDYTARPFYATFTRWLKYLSFFIATLLPGLYVAFATFHPEILPNTLLNKVAIAIATTPLPLMLETLLIHFIYEIMREAGLRLPRPLGHAVSIVGALVIGETAVSSGLIGGPTLMVVALTAISSYVIPSLYEPVAVLRILFILVGGTLGIWGIMLLFSVVLINLCAKKNYGIPYTAPVSPFSFFAMRDVLIRAGWKTLSKKVNNVQNMPGSNLKHRKEKRP